MRPHGAEAQLVDHPRLVPRSGARIQGPWKTGPVVPFGVLEGAFTFPEMPWGTCLGKRVTACEPFYFIARQSLRAGGELGSLNQ